MALFITLFAVRLPQLDRFLHILDGPDPAQRTGAILLVALIVASLLGLAYLLTRQREEQEKSPRELDESSTIPENAIRIGACGRTVSNLCPGGKIEIAGRRLDARCEEASIAPGAQVIVSGGDAFNLVVRRLEPGFVPATMRGFGDPVLSHEQRRAALLEREKEDEQRRLEDARRQRGQAPRYGAGAALVWGAALLAWQWTLTLANPIEALLAVALALAAGVAASLLLWFHDDAAVASLGMIAGTVLSGLFTVPALGLLAGVFVALGIGAALMLLAFFLILFGFW